MVRVPWKGGGPSCEEQWGDRIKTYTAEYPAHALGKALLALLLLFPELVVERRRRRWGGWGVDRFPAQSPLEGGLRQARGRSTTGAEIDLEGGCRLDRACTRASAHPQLVGGFRQAKGRSTAGGECDLPGGYRLDRVTRSRAHSQLVGGLRQAKGRSTAEGECNLPGDYRHDRVTIAWLAPVDGGRRHIESVVLGVVLCVYFGLPEAEK